MTAARPGTSTGDSARTRAASEGGRFRGARGRLALWLALGALLTGVFLLTDLIQGVAVRPEYLAVLGLVCSAIWMAAAPAIWALAGRWPLHGERELRHAALHLATAFAFAFLLTTAFALGMWAVDRAWGGPTTLAQAFRGAVYYFLLAKLLYYALVATARRAHDMALRSERVQGELVRARLDALRLQMNPHFLFNALNTVAGLVRARDDAAALRVVARLGGVLRRSLEEEDSPEAPLESELAVLDELVEIERCRFGERLRFRLEVPDELLATPIPRWILQPLVENAVRHGLEASPDAGTIVLRARSSRGRLLLEVEDDGPGPDGDGEEGIGLGNTRARLETLHGAAAGIDVARRPGGGTRVTVRLPLAARGRRA